jgi:hypothetical protein
MFPKRSSILLILLVVTAGCGGRPAAEPGNGQTPASRPATPGVGRQGRDYATGPVSTPVQALWTTRQRLALLQLVQPMNLYRVEHGHFPKTHEEFMEKIVRAYGIQLPELPEAERYVYDAERAAAMSSYDPDDPPLRVESSPE